MKFLIAAVFAACQFMAFAQPETQPAAPAGPPETEVSDPQVKGGLTKDDQMFIRETYRDGQAEIQLLKMAMSKAVDNEARKFAAGAMKDHVKTQEELKQLAGKYNVVLPGDIGPHQQKIDMLQKDSGKEFDTNYMRAMVRDHEKAERDIHRASRECNNEELRKWAGNVLKVVREHQKVAKEISQKMGGGGRTEEDERPRPDRPPGAPDGPPPPGSDGPPPPPAK